MASEHKFQATLVDELQSTLRPQVVMTALASGGLRHPVVAKKLKAEGVQPGMPDLLFALPQGKTFWLELKRADEKTHKDGGLSDAQVGIHYKLQQNGHDVAVAHTIEEALLMLSDRGLLR